MHKALLLSLFTASGTALADDSYRFEVTPFAGYRTGGEFETEDGSVNIRLRDSASVGFLVNGDVSYNTEWEFLYSNQQTEARVTEVTGAAEDLVDYDTHTFQLGGTYLFEGESVIPYLAMTIGGTHVRTRAIEEQSDTFLSGSIGLGLRLLPSSRVGMRLEARAYGVIVDSSTDLFCSTGPNANVCAVRLKGELVSQVEMFAGISVRF
jgi:hypothetical protein